MFLGKGVLKICNKFIRENPCRSLISIIEIAEIFRTPFSKSTYGRLLLLSAFCLLILREWSSDQQNQPPELFYKKSILINFAKFTGQLLCLSLFFNKVAGGTCNLIEKGLWHRCLLVNFRKLTSFLQNISGQLLLYWLSPLYCRQGG